jgi:hypothetical protein
MASYTQQNPYYGQPASQGGYNPNAGTQRSWMYNPNLSAQNPQYNAPVGSMGVAQPNAQYPYTIGVSGMIQQGPYGATMPSTGSIDPNSLYGQLMMGQYGGSYGQGLGGGQATQQVASQVRSNIPGDVTSSINQAKAISSEAIGGQGLARALYEGPEQLARNQVTNSGMNVSSQSDVAQGNALRQMAEGRSKSQGDAFMNALGKILSQYTAINRV